MPFSARVILSAICCVYYREGVEINEVNTHAFMQLCSEIALGDNGGGGEERKVCVTSLASKNGAGSI